MPINTTTWRSHPHTTEVFAFIYNPSVVFSCSVNQATFTYPVPELTYDGATGSFADINIDHLIKVESVGGVFKGWARARKAATSTKLYIGHIGQGDIDFEDNDVLTVLDDYRVMTRVPRYLNNGTILNDYEIVYDDQNENIDPICNAGGPVVGFVDPDNTDLLTVDFDLTNSFAMANGLTVSPGDFSGDLIDGSVTSGSIASGVFTAEFPAGFRYCEFSIEDSNGNIGSIKVPVKAVDDTLENVYPVVIDSHRIDIDNGSSISFTILADGIDEDEIVPESLVIIFVKEKYNTTEGSLQGVAGRENIYFVGWLKDDRIDIDPDTDNVSFTAVDLAGKLAMLQGYPFSITNKTSPNKWTELKSLSLLRFMNYFLRWHTTVMTFTDLQEPAWNSIYTETPRRLDADGGTVYQQLKMLAAYVTAEFGTDKNGILRIERNPQYMSDADRDDLVTTVELTEGDFANAEWTERHERQVYWLRGSGVVADLTKITPKLAIAPGTSPGQGPKENTLDRQLILDQTDLNIRTGRQYTLDNTKIPDLSVTVFRAGFVAHPLYGQIIQITVPASSNKRGSYFSDSLFILKEVDISYSTSGITSEEWRLEPLIYGVAATTQVVPKDKATNITYTVPTTTTYPYVPPLNIPLIKPIKPLPAANSPALVVVTSGVDNNDPRVLRLKQGTTSWEILTRILLDSEEEIPSNHIIVDAQPDPFNPADTIYAVICAESSGLQPAVLEIENVSGPVGTQEIKIPYGTFVGEDIVGISGGGPSTLDASVGIDGMMGFVAGDSVIGPCIIKRDGRRSVFQKIALNQGGIGYAMKFGYHPTDVDTGDVYAFVDQIAGGSFYSRTLKSTTNGDTWGTDFTNDIGVFAPAGGYIKMHSFGNSDDETYYFHSYADVYNNNQDSLMRHNVDNSTDAIAPFVSGDSEYLICDVLGTSDQNGTNIAVFGRTSAGTYGYRSSDNGDTWEEINVPDDATRPVFGTIYPFDEDVMVLVQNSGIWVSTNLFSGSAMSITWTDVTYDFDTVQGGTNPAQYISAAWKVWSN